MKRKFTPVGPLFQMGNQDYGLILGTVPNTGGYYIESFVAGHGSRAVLPYSKEVVQTLLTFAVALANNPHSTVDEEDVVSLVAFFNSNI